MNYVTNLILHFSADEDHVDGYAVKGVRTRRYTLGEKINHWLNDPERRLGELAYMNPHVSGSQPFMGAVFMGAFNYIDLDEFMSMLKSLDWQYPDQVQLFARTDNDQIFEEVD